MVAEFGGAVLWELAVVEAGGMVVDELIVAAIPPSQEEPNTKDVRMHPPAPFTNDLLVIPVVLTTLFGLIAFSLS